MDPDLEAALTNLREKAPAGKADEEDLLLLFRRFARSAAPHRGPGSALSPLELRGLLQAVQAPGEAALPEGFAERLYEAWAPQEVPLTEGRFKAGFKVYMQQREKWLEQWWLALSGGSSNQAPNQRLVAEVRKEHGMVHFEQFEQFCNQLAQELGQLNPPPSFLHAVWRATATPEKERTLEGSQLLQILPVLDLRPISDAAYDALLQAYSDQWQLWLEDWISERQLLMDLTQEEDEEVKAAIVVQRHFRAYHARKEVKSKRLELFLGDLAGTMSNRNRATKLFLQFSGGKSHWSSDDMADFCTAIWKQDGLLPPPRAFGLDALKKLQKMAVGKGKSDAAGQVVTRDDFRRGLMMWYQRRFRQLQKWELSRYREVYVCPCCRGRFRLAKATDERGQVIEIAKVVDAGVTPGVTSLTSRSGAAARFAVPERSGGAAGSAARKLPHPSDVAALHDQVARDVAKGAGLCLLPPGSARPALAGRLLLQAAVAGTSTGAPLLLLADDHELEAVRLWLASAAPKYEVIKASLQQQTPISKVTGHQLATILLASPFTFERLGLKPADLDYVLLSCSAREIPMLRECDDRTGVPFSFTSKRPRVVCLLDSTCEIHQTLQQHLEALQEARGHMSKALQHLESTQDGGYSQACLEDFSQHVSRFPAAVRFTDAPPKDGDEVPLPLGFTGPLKPLKRGAVIRSKQDDMSSEEETDSSTLSPAAKLATPVTRAPPPEPAPEPVSLATPRAAQFF